MTCPRTHTWQRVEPGVEKKVSKVHALRHYLAGIGRDGEETTEWNQHWLEEVTWQFTWERKPGFWKARKLPTQGTPDFPKDGTECSFLTKGPLQAVSQQMFYTRYSILLPQNPSRSITTPGNTYIRNYMLDPSDTVFTSYSCSTQYNKLLNRTKFQPSWGQQINQTYPNTSREKQIEDMNKNRNANGQ